jgi:hypothetical protein
MSDKIIIEPIKEVEFTVKQSKYEIAPRLPMRSIILGPSGSGKTVLLTNLILKVYRDTFERIYIFSPSISVDYAWAPVKKYIEEQMKVYHNEKDPIYFDSYEPDKLQRIIDQQHKIIEYLKRNNKKKLFSILIVVDDFADSPEFSRHSKILHALYTRGRHNSISTITATQKFNAISPIIRVNITELYVYRLRNYKDLETLLEELSALIDRKTLLNIYNLATDEPYSFLFVNLRARSVNNMFYINFNKKIELE